LFRTNYFNSIGGMQQDSNTSVAWTYGVEAQTTSRLSDAVVLTAGLNARINDVVSDVYGNQVQTLFSAYGQAEWTARPGMIVTAGARVDREETITVDPNLVISPKLGLSWSVSDATSLRASLGRGFRAPTIAERYATIQYSAIRVVPAERLLPEFSWSAELGVNHRVSGAPFPMEVDMAVFDNELFDMIEPAFLPSGVVQFQNITRARVLGAEITVRAMLASWAGVETGLTLMDPKDLVVEQTLKYRNNVIWYSRGSLRPFDGVELQIEHRFLNRTERIDALAIVPDYDVRVPIHIVDARLLWSVASMTRVMLQARNVMDYYYTSIMANLGPTRSVQMQVEWAL
jgi:outer membrane receptor protein involved in Fe transport